MAKYLDYAGLQYLWTKIKNYVSTQPLGANVRYDAQELTSAQQAQARANIAAGGTNPNLLDNPWFTVRQRGNGPFTSGYTVDRWKVSGGTPTITPRSPYGINISASSAFAFDEFTGMDSAALLGKTVTLSVLIGGVVYSGTATYTSSTSININVQAGGIYVRLLYDANHPQIRIYGAETNNVDIDAVKLELGSVSTLANDAPPNYAEELRKCQYYYREWSITSAGGFAIAWPWSNANATIMNIFGIGNEMRTKSPTITWSGSWTVRTQSGANIAITNISKADSPTALGIDITVASGLTNNQPCRVTADSGATITFSADL